MPVYSRKCFYKIEVLRVRAWKTLNEALTKFALNVKHGAGLDCKAFVQLADGLRIQFGAQLGKKVQNDIAILERIGVKNLERHVLGPKNAIKLFKARSVSWPEAAGILEREVFDLELLLKEALHIRHRLADISDDPRPKAFRAQIICKCIDSFFGGTADTFSGKDDVLARLEGQINLVCQFLHTFFV